MNKLKSTFIEGIFIKRYKRFFADIRLNNKKIVTAHCPNTGSMMGLLNEGDKALISKSDDPKRKLKYTLEVLKGNNGHIGVNTHRANRIVEDAIISGKIKELGKIIEYKREVKYGENSRIDFLIKTKNDISIFLEVKNVTLSRKKSLSEFPDAVTERGTKHLLELAKLPNKNTKAMMFYLIQRDDCTSFKIAQDIDPNYFDNFKKARKQGVEVICYNCSFDNSQIKVNKRVKLIN